mmetsp:Transcript_32552/g.36238  ORF Transcript_32552/g.36238 Transcript_32552/m.36238 type:complete len:355 (+) Transcript_32552:203-1267(+)
MIFSTAISTRNNMFVVVLSLFFASSSIMTLTTTTDAFTPVAPTPISSTTSTARGMTTDYYKRAAKSIPRGGKPSTPSKATTPRTVLVTGAGGKTGRLVLQKLLSRGLDHYIPMGLVRTQESKAGLEQEGVPSCHITIGDITDANSLAQAMEGKDAVIICTSGTPAPTGEMNAEGRPIFGYPNGQPEQVDWIGQKNTIDAAKIAQASSHNTHVVVCSSMGGTDPDNMLNTLARNADGTGGNILLWKRKAEKYLIESGLTYTIIHPGGLIDEEGGRRELVVGVDDSQAGTESRVIPRADVAELLVQSLEHDSYQNRSFDARSKPEDEQGSTITTDYNQLLVDLPGNCDYTLGKIPE